MRYTKTIASKVIAFMVAVLIVGAVAAASYNALVYIEQGGSRMVVADGGSLDIESGGEIDIESGATLAVNGTIDIAAGNLEIADTAVTSTAAELNVLDTFTGDVADLEWAKTLLDTGVTEAEYDQLDDNMFTAHLNINSSTIAIVEGTTEDAYEMTFKIVDPTMDNTFTIPDVADGAIVLSSLMAEADIDAGSASTKWTVSDTANWTVDVGTGNGRGGGNVLEFATDNTVDDELTFDNTSVIDLTGMNYISFWLRNDGGTIAADELDVDLRTPADTILTNCGGIQIPAMAQDDWTAVTLDISSCTEKDRFQKLAIVADTGITANTLVDVQGFIAHKMSNGTGPPRGRLEYHPVSSGTVTQGQVVCAPEIPSMDIGVETCDANDYAPMGLAVTTSTTYVVIQTSGVAIMEAGNAVTDNADVDVLSGAVTIDDAGSIENSIGYAMEAAADANDFIYVRLQF